jgi:hypothetical protein
MNCIKKSKPFGLALPFDLIPITLFYAQVLMPISVYKGQKLTRLLVLR